MQKNVITIQESRIHIMQHTVHDLKAKRFKTIVYYYLKFFGNNERDNSEILLMEQIAKLKILDRVHQVHYW